MIIFPDQLRQISYPILRHPIRKENLRGRFLRSKSRDVEENPGTLISKAWIFTRVYASKIHRESGELRAGHLERIEGKVAGKLVRFRQWTEETEERNSEKGSRYEKKKKKKGGGKLITYYIIWTYMLRTTCTYHGQWLSIPLINHIGIPRFRLHTK